MSGQPSLRTFGECNGCGSPQVPRPNSKCRNFPCKGRVNVPKDQKDQERLRARLGLPSTTAQPPKSGDDETEKEKKKKDNKKSPWSRNRQPKVDANGTDKPDSSEPKSAPKGEKPVVPVSKDFKGHQTWCIKCHNPGHRWGSQCKLAAKASAFRLQPINLRYKVPGETEAEKAVADQAVAQLTPETITDLLIQLAVFRERMNQFDQWLLTRDDQLRHNVAGLEHNTNEQLVEEYNVLVDFCNVWAAGLMRQLNLWLKDIYADLVIEAIQHHMTTGTPAQNQQSTSFSGKAQETMKYFESMSAPAPRVNYARHREHRMTLHGIFRWYLDGMNCASSALTELLDSWPIFAKKPSLMHTCRYPFQMMPQLAEEELWTTTPLLNLVSFPESGPLMTRLSAAAKVDYPSPEGDEDAPPAGKLDEELSDFSFGEDDKESDASGSTDPEIRDQIRKANEATA